MKMKWQFVNPTRVLSGLESLAELSSWISHHDPDGQIIGVFTGSKSASTLGYLDQVQQHLQEHQLHLFSGIEPEPSHKTVREGASFIATQGITTAIALGGGSVMDAVKAMCCLAHSDLDVRSIMDREKVVTGRRVKLVAIPMTAGTGSEVTPYSVLTNEERGVKQSLASYWFYPDLAILIPDFVVTVPPKVIADVGIDSLAHAFEALWSIHSNPISDALAFNAIEEIFAVLPRYFKDPHNLTAAARMQASACIAGRSFSNTFTAACHALSFPIGAEFRLSHGHSCAMTLWLIAELNMDAVRPKFERIAKFLGLSSASEVPEAIKHLTERVEEVTRFGQLNAGEDSLRRIARGAFKPLLANNPVALTEDEIVRLLARAL
jgi:alcohol dehydrogenase class IV